MEPTAGSSVHAAVVQLRGIVKRFGSTAVLNDIHLDFHRAEIHALIGENGAGKSTVGKIIGGYYVADAGQIIIFGQPVDAWSPRRALQHGIAMIHQEIQLVPELTVVKNVFLGIERNFLGVLEGSERKRFDELEQRCRFGLDPDAVVGTLGIAQRQKVEIMRAIAREAKVIIMDEPTSSLTADETARLHEVMAALKADGATIIYVTHFLDHVLAQADRVTVMRDGAVMRTSPIANETKQTLVGAMLGQSADVAFPDLPPRPDDDIAPLLVVRDLSTDADLKSASLVVRRGEIVGLVGLVGSGRSELARAIFGADRPTAGTIALDGKEYSNPTPKRSVERGLVLVPEDRRKQGLILTQPVRPNMALPHLSLGSRFGILDEARERLRTKELIDHFEIRPNAIDGAVVNYSGGNQQKVLLSKWVFNSPRVIILDEPSRGVDIGARRRIHDFIVEAAASGSAIILISSELEEVMALSHRCYLMNEGSIVGEVDPRTTTVAEVLFRLFNISGVLPGGEAVAAAASAEFHQ
jgi:ribose transport system ATP-binding protein